MLTKSTHGLKDVAEGLLRPLNQTELKLALADLQEAGRHEPSVATMLKTEGPLRDFIAAVLTLSPYLREIVNLDPSVLAGAVTEPLEPQIEALIAEARRCWQPDGEGAAPAESVVMTRLRTIKRKVAFLVAVADLARIFD